MYRRNMPLEANLMWVKDFVARFSAEFKYLYEFYRDFGILSKNRMKTALDEAKQAAKHMAKAKKLEQLQRFRGALEEYEESWTTLSEALSSLNVQAKREKYLRS